MTTELATKPAAEAGDDAPAHDRNRTLLLVLPAYNEGPRLDAVLQDVRDCRPDADILVVDDGSHDDTEQRALKGGASVARHPFNLGYGAALETGYLYGALQGYELLVQMDADGQHDARSIDSLLEPILDARADVVVGSRFLTASGYRSSLGRRGGSYLFGRLATWLTGRPITDPTSGFWAMNGKAIAALTGGVLPHDYPDADILIGMHYAGLRLAEVPVLMRSASGGRSMHAGFRPVYYTFKMLLSIFLTLLGRRPGPV